MTVAAMPGAGVSGERRVFLGMIFAVSACVFLGFSRSFFLRPLFPDAQAGSEIWLYVHGAIFTAWLALIGTQAALVASGRVAWHRRLGVAGFVMVPLVVIVGAGAALIAAHRPGGFIGIPAPPLVFLAVPFTDLVAFAFLAGSALALRRKPMAHKRLMLLATVVMVEAGAARWPFEIMQSAVWLAFVVKCLFVAPLILWDLASLRRVHWATLLGGAVILLEGPERALLTHSDAWFAFGRWATGLLG